ncbi:MAG: hypothetical protein ABIO69_04375 [Sphingomicrobium sp.]
MPRFYFNIRNGFGFAADEEGLDLLSEQDARQRAIHGARSLISAEVLDGMLDLNGQIEITDEHQRDVMVVRFADAVKVRPDNGAHAAKPN